MDDLQMNTPEWVYVMPRFKAQGLTLKSRNVLDFGPIYLSHGQFASGQFFSEAS